jgi:hypothetical protein
MAWRIHDSVRRGEIDNREKGVVRGRIWLHGQPEPVVLELRGNAHADLAGCLLAFENPLETIPMRTGVDFNALQRGTIGDLTASRKVRVFDIPAEDAYERLKKKLAVPEHMANLLYLEWFSDANGRVVVESADYQLTVSAPAWRLSPADEQQRQADAAAGWTGFVHQLNEAVESEQTPPASDKAWNEFDYEKLLRESDARTDKYLELLDKYEDHPDRERLIAKEMGWSWDDEDEEAESSDEGNLVAESAPGADGETSEGDAGDAPFDVDEMNRACADAVEPPPEPDPATEGVDWVRDEDGDVSHPLSLRAFNSSMALWHRCNALGLGKEDDELCRLLGEFQNTGAKLAGALNSLAYGRDLTEGAFVVACLKRALNHLHLAHSALEKVAPRDLLPAETLSSTRAELFGIREEILRLMEEFRRG